MFFREERTMKKGVIALVLFGLLQLVPVDRSNPPVRAGFFGPDRVEQILKRSCYDCHSYETRWPWYSRIAPISFMVAHNVKEARAELNFSEWRTYGSAKRAEIGAEMIDLIEKNEMPPPLYAVMHGETRLSGAELETLRNWQP
jgi:hypothetical protein